MNLKLHYASWPSLCWKETNDLTFQNWRSGQINSPEMLSKFDLNYVAQNIISLRPTSCWYSGQSNILKVFRRLDPTYVPEMNTINTLMLPIVWLGNMVKIDRDCLNLSHLYQNLRFRSDYRSNHCPRGPSRELELTYSLTRKCGPGIGLPMLTYLSRIRTDVFCLQYAMIA